MTSVERLARPTSVLVLLVMSSVALGLAVSGDAGECPRVEITAHLLQGDAAPGTGASFETFDRPNISESGAICFAGDTDADSSEDDVVYVNLTLVAREDDPAPGVGAGRYAAFEFFETAHQVNDTSDVVFIATLRNVPSGTNRAVYRNAELIARSGESPGAIRDRVYDDFGFAGVSDTGAVGFLADLGGDTGDDSVIFVGEELRYREGDIVPILDPVRWDGNFDEIQWNGRGDLLFEGNTTLGGNTDMVVYRRRVGSGAGEGDGPVEDIVAQEGQTVDARGGRDFLELILQTALAENGMWGLRGNLGVAPSTEDAVILTEVGFFAQQGDPVPELPGTVLGNFNAVNINSHGDVIYLADLEGDVPPSVDEGIFVNGCLIVTDEEPAPGLPVGTRFSDLGFEDLYVNDAREIVFAASYTGAVVGDGLFTFTLPATCGADIDGSGGVDFGDILAVLAEWGPYEPCPPFAPEDLDEDCDVGFGDVLVVLAEWGPCD